MSSITETIVRIFISYRRDDSAGYARRIYTWLSTRIGNGAVFLDGEGIEPGDDYAKTIYREIRRSNLLLAIMGRRCKVSLDSDGLSRLEKPDDLVRRELLTAIGSGVYSG
jgi:TIR domain-containing protein